MAKCGFGECTWLYLAVINVDDTSVVTSRLLTAVHLLNYIYRIYSCISRPFITKIQPKKIALDLYTSHTQIPDQAIQEISITIAWSALGKPSFRNQF